MKKTILELFVVGILIFILASSSANLLAQARTNPPSFSLGVVDVETVVKEMPEALAADQELMEFTRRIQDTITERRKELETKVQNYQRQRAMMTAANQQEQEERFNQEMLELQGYGTEKEREIAQLRERLLEPIRARVRASIEAVAKSENISMVLSKEGALVLYYDPRQDITFRVIDHIKRNR